MSQPDHLIRFLFEHHAVRGQWIELSSSIEYLLAGHDYPESVSHLLIEAAMATNMMAQSLKFKGRLSLQAQSDGPISLILVQANHENHFRGIARVQGQTPNSSDLKELMKGAHMALTIEPENGKRYQGVVPMYHSQLGENLAEYFEQSEQLKTQFWFFVGAGKACGLMLQAMPENSSSGSFEHLTQLANTLCADEALNLPVEQLLYRLFHQDPLRLFPPQSVSFNCGCSREKTLSSLATVPQAEIEQIIKEDGAVKMQCDFCQAEYVFDSIDVAQIYANAGINMQSGTEQ